MIQAPLPSQHPRPWRAQLPASAAILAQAIIDSHGAVALIASCKATGIIDAAAHEARRGEARRGEVRRLTCPRRTTSAQSVTKTERRGAPRADEAVVQHSHCAPLAIQCACAIVASGG